MVVVLTMLMPYVTIPAYAGDIDITDIAAGGGYTLALTSDGSVWAWGQNDYGTLGQGDLEDRNTPTRIEGLSKMWLGRTLGKLETASSKCEEYILQGIQIVNELKLKPYSARGYLFLGELYADRGQREKALENLKKAEGMFKEMGMDYWLVKTQEVLDKL